MTECTSKFLACFSLSDVYGGWSDINNLTVHIVLAFLHFINAYNIEGWNIDHAKYVNFWHLIG